MHLYHHGTMLCQFVIVREWQPILSHVRSVREWQSIVNRHLRQRDGEPHI